MTTHSSILAWRIPGTGEAWWAAVYGVAQSRTRLKRLSSSSSSSSIIRVVDINPPFSIISNLSRQKMNKGKLGLKTIKLDLFNNTLF